VKTEYKRQKRNNTKPAKGEENASRGLKVHRGK